MKILPNESKQIGSSFLKSLGVPSSSILSTGDSAVATFRPSSSTRNPPPYKVEKALHSIRLEGFSLQKTSVDRAELSSGFYKSHTVIAATLYFISLEKHHVQCFELALMPEFGQLLIRKNSD